MDDYAYDSLGRVVSAHRHGVNGGDAVADVEVDFTYNASNQIVSIDRYQSGQLAVEADYTYNAAGELIGWFTTKARRHTIPTPGRTASAKRRPSVPRPERGNVAFATLRQPRCR